MPERIEELKRTIANLRAEVEQMSTDTTAQSTENRPSRLRRRDLIGLCLRCGRRLTLCGAPFTAEIPCNKCLYINIYKESIQPVSGRG